MAAYVIVQARQSAHSLRLKAVEAEETSFNLMFMPAPFACSWQAIPEERRMHQNLEPCFS
ncbi:MAG: hypothetical protein PHV34_21520 [Verrucomicrobiae bacterium]|nr:hypothetical protein [Verrucomicrobiae bacterium]